MLYTSWVLVPNFFGKKKNVAIISPAATLHTEAHDERSHPAIESSRLCWNLVWRLNLYIHLSHKIV